MLPLDLNQAGWQVACITVLGICTFFINNQALEPSIMEARNLITAREMVQDHHWLIPTMNEEYRLAKPPFPTWVTAWTAQITGGFHSLGVLRIPAGLMGFIMAFSLYAIAKCFTRDKLIPV